MTTLNQEDLNFYQGWTPAMLLLGGHYLEPSAGRTFLLGGRGLLQTLQEREGTLQSRLGRIGGKTSGIQRRLQKRFQAANRQFLSELGYTRQVAPGMLRGTNPIEERYQLRKARVQRAGQAMAGRAKASYHKWTPLRQGLRKMGKTVGIWWGVDIALMLGKMAGGLAASSPGEAYFSKYQVPRPSFAGGPAYTQRQRALAAIHNSQLTNRAILGQEAGYMHQ